MFIWKQTYNSIIKYPLFFHYFASNPSDFSLHNYIRLHAMLRKHSIVLFSPIPEQMF